MSGLVTWDPDGVRAWADAAPKEGAVLVHSLRGFIDAGKAGALVATHLLGDEPVLEHQRARTGARGQPPDAVRHRSSGCGPNSR